MRVASMNYVQWEGTPREWRIDGVLLNPINLLVGSNASGKSRILNVISGLAKLLAGDTKLMVLSGDYNVTFDDDGRQLKYSLRYEGRKVIKEEFESEGKRYLQRGAGGEGTIWAVKLGEDIEFQVPQDELAAVARRDSIQHPFFEPLSSWGKSLYHYYFGTKLGQEVLGLIDPVRAGEVNPRDPNQVIGIYLQGEKAFGDNFKDAIKRDMAEIGYLIDDVGTKNPISIIVPDPQSMVALYVKETGLGDITDQFDMSQGMFRALSIIIQLNYSEMTRKPSCVLIDDIGEGLDFDRSCALIKLIMQKAEKSAVQLIMSTNDRFVMNAVPLEAWTVLRRAGQKIRVYNYTNSKGRFDQFKFTGMNNFDFYAYNFLDESRNG